LRGNTIVCEERLIQAMPPLWITVYDAPELDSLGECYPSSSKSLNTVRIDLGANQTRSIPHHRDMNDDEKEDIWYTRYDIKQAQSSLHHLLHRLNSGLVVPESDSQTKRGSEVYISAGLRCRKQQRQQHIQAVLGEQRRQEETELVEEEELAFVARLHSRLSVDKALRMAVGDEEFANQSANQATSLLPFERQVESRVAVRFCSWWQGTASKSTEDDEESLLSNSTRYEWALCEAVSKVMGFV
jgi:hypothetical protein